jgi:hypothetical protein
MCTGTLLGGGRGRVGQCIRVHYVEEEWEEVNVYGYTM